MYVLLLLYVSCMCIVCELCTHTPLVYRPKTHKYPHPLTQEPPTTADGAPPGPPHWPSTGTLTYDLVSASYRPGLPLVLNQLSFHIPGGTTCGVVGRTGSGKSSLLLTLFRLLNVAEGRIVIDGVDITSMGLDVLRRQLAVIPQDPVLFSGSLR